MAKPYGSVAEKFLSKVEKKKYFFLEKRKPFFGNKQTRF